MSNDSISTTIIEYFSTRLEAWSPPGLGKQHLLMSNQVTSTPNRNVVLGMLLGLVFIGVLTTVVKVLRVGQRDSKLPPGPPTVPIFGNELSIPKSNAHIQFSKWAKQYGPIYTLKRYSNTTIVVSDPSVVREMMDRKSNVYSHRPQSTVGDLITQGDHLLLMQYGEGWRLLRKLVHQHFMEPVCESSHVTLQNAEATQMIYDFMTSPGDHMQHPKRYSNSITNSLVFGIRTSSIKSPYLTRLFSLLEKWSEVLEVGATPPVDSFQILKLVPESWLGSWKSRATEVGKLMTDLYTEVLDQVKQRRESGVRLGSLMDIVLDQQGKNNLTEQQLFFLGGVLMEGGSDTSSSLIIAIIRAMIEYPEVLKKAQAEIDAHVPDSRTPTWEDFPNLPYMNLIIKESQRWRPVSPLGVSHAVAQDDTIRGYVLPKGATVVLNVWGMHHNDQAFEEPERFMPERYKDFPRLASHYTGDASKRDHFGYGAGRRVCPGMHLAERNLFIGASKLLWAFDIRANADLGAIESSKGFLQCLSNYDNVITVRSEARAATIRREMEEQRAVFEKYESN